MDRRARRSRRATARRFLANPRRGPVPPAGRRRPAAHSRSQESLNRGHDSPAIFFDAGTYDGIQAVHSFADAPHLPRRDDPQQSALNGVTEQATS